MNADQYTRRYEAIHPLALNALLDFEALQAWARQNRIDFEWLGTRPVGRFIPFEGLSVEAAMHFVDRLVGDHADQKRTIIRHCREDYPDMAEMCHDEDELAVLGISRRLDRLMLCAVFDGKLKLYCREGREIDTVAVREAWGI